MEEIGVQIRRLNYKVKVLVHAGKKENKKKQELRVSEVHLRYQITNFPPGVQVS